MKKSIMIFIIIVFILMIGTIVFILFPKEDRVENTNVNIEEENNQKVENKDISFIRTYYIVEILDYQDSANEYTYIVVDKFQNFDPYIIKLKKDIAKDLKEDIFYEFTFKGKYNKEITSFNIKEVFDNFDVIDIKMSTKSGLEQIQENGNTNNIL